MIKGLIFDMDGVIIDSSQVIYDIWNDYLKKNYDKTIPKEDFGLNFGRSSRDFVEYFIKKYHLNTTFDKMMPILRKDYYDLINRIHLKKGVKENIPILKKKYKIALATGAHKEYATLTMKKLHASKYFAYIIGGDEVKQAKPEPDIFLKAAENLGVKPNECIVIEDAILGIRAAKRAGMIAVSIQDEFTKYQDHSIADYKLNSLLELTDEFINSIESS